MKEIDLIIRNSKHCYMNYINYLSWFDKRKNIVITNHIYPYMEINEANQLFIYPYSSKYLLLCLAEFIQVGNNMRESKWWQHFNLWLNYFFSQQGFHKLFDHIPQLAIFWLIWSTNNQIQDSWIQDFILFFKQYNPNFWILIIAAALLPEIFTFLLQTGHVST